MSPSQKKIVDQLKTPKTLDELEQILIDDLDRISIRGRLSELRRNNFVVKNGNRYSLTPAYRKEIQ